MQPIRTLKTTWASLIRPLALIVLGATYLPFAMADELRIGTMHVPWLDGCKGKTERRRISMECPSGERITISALPRQQGSTDDEAWEKSVDLADELSKEIMIPSAEKHGEVMRALVRTKSKSNAVIHSIVSQRTRAGRDYFLLQYAVSGQGGVVFFTIEGYGEGAAQTSRFDGLFSEARFE
ncbi:MAG: hypothetical protein GC151_14495 [Betaproteobacteria bacterium]|nr:hypothetical protein [Betaproteobacteria bacterium]